MIRKIYASVLCCFVLTVCGCWKEKTKTAEETPTTQIQQPSKVLDYLTLSAYYLINQQKPDGFFKYEYDFITGNYTPWDNIIHQTRAGYALIQYYSFLIRYNIDSQQAAFVLSSVTKALQGYEAASVSHDKMPGKLISFYYNKHGSASLETPKIDSKQKEKRLEAEIAATAFAFITELSYWNNTSDATFAEIREEWLKALIHFARQALQTPIIKHSFISAVWQALAVYAQINPDDTEINALLEKTDNYFLAISRPIKDVEDYTWDILAAKQRFQTTQKLSFVDFASRQTTRLLEDMYAQHDPTVNSCSLSLGLAEASLILTGLSGDYARIEQTALGRSQLEYYSSLKYTILPNQAWIPLGPGRTLHSQDFKRFVGASTFGRHLPRTNIGLVEMCLLNGMRFSNADLNELKQKTGKD